MKKPGFLTTLFGNSVVACLIGFACLYLLYLAVFEGGSGWVAIGALFAAGWVTRTHDRFQKYMAWKREWEAMEGALPSPAHKAGIRYGLGILAYCLGAWAMLSMRDQPGMQIPVALFWLATALAVVVGFYRLAKKPSARRNQASLVRVCVPGKGGSPAQAAYAQLPDYCQRLFHQLP